MCFFSFWMCTLCTAQLCVRRRLLWRHPFQKSTPTSGAFLYFPPPGVLGYRKSISPTKHLAQKVGWGMHWAAPFLAQGLGYNSLKSRERKAKTSLEKGATSILMQTRFIKICLDFFEIFFGTNKQGKRKVRTKDRKKGKFWSPSGPLPPSSFPRLERENRELYSGSGSGGRSAGGGGGESRPNIVKRASLLGEAFINRAFDRGKRGKKEGWEIQTLSFRDRSQTQKPQINGISDGYESKIYESNQVESARFRIESLNLCKNF